ncbi:DUF1307 domain-containing protein [Fundicoccus sp. Sow4_D5]|uniref:DUF1307 domain-containing protein n=1 Tax=unclassified Fundicoccus TaxID=2761543 RepID=UPI003F9189D6
MKKIIYLFLALITLTALYTLWNARQLKESHYILEQDTLTVELAIEHQANKLIHYTAITNIQFEDEQYDEMVHFAQTAEAQFEGFSGVTMETEILDNSVVTTQQLVFEEMNAHELADEPNLANFTNGVISFGQLEQALFQQGFKTVEP